MDTSDAMTVRCTDVGAALVVTVQGEIDIETAPQLRETFEQTIITHPRKPVVADLHDVTFLSSTGLAVLADIDRFAAQHAVELRIATGNARLVLRPLEITGLSRALALYPDLQTALAAANPEPNTHAERNTSSAGKDRSDAG